MTDDQGQITGARSSLRKEEMTETIREILGFGRAEAEPCADRVLEGKPAVLFAADRETAVGLVDRLKRLGADAEAGDG